MTRETVVVLNDGNSVFTGLKSASADQYYTTKVRMAVSVHNHSVNQLWFSVRDSDEAMKQLFKCYDPIIQYDLKHSEQCGTMLGVPVFLDDTLKARLMIIESEPIPADKFYTGAYREVT